MPESIDRHDTRGPSRERNDDGHKKINQPEILGEEQEKKQREKWLEDVRSCAVLHEIA